MVKLLVAFGGNVTDDADVIAGGTVTLIARRCAASGSTPFEAVSVTNVEPAGPAGVPAIVAVPSPTSWNARPAGIASAVVMAAVGEAVVLIVTLPATPRRNDARGGVVNVGARRTVSMKFWTAAGLTPFAAVSVSGYVPAVPALGVP